MHSLGRHRVWLHLSLHNMMWWLTLNASLYLALLFQCLSCSNRSCINLNYCIYFRSFCLYLYLSLFTSLLNYLPVHQSVQKYTTVRLLTIISRSLFLTYYVFLCSCACICDVLIRGTCFHVQLQLIYVRTHQWSFATLLFLSELKKAGDKL